jgi:hypothetical protein
MVVVLLCTQRSARGTCVSYQGRRIECANLIQSSRVIGAGGGRGGCVPRGWEKKMAKEGRIPYGRERTIVEVGRGCWAVANWAAPIVLLTMPWGTLVM